LSAEQSIPSILFFASADLPEAEESTEISQDTDTRTSKFNPDFWEVTVNDAGWRGFTTQDYPYYESDEDLDARQARDERARGMRCEIEAVIAEVLTDRQREVVELYFFGRMNQRQIGERLEISQQVVSEHLYGKMRGGKAVGGALRKLRKVCADRGGASGRRSRRTLSGSRLCEV
jgi:RNA polymerase sigma factor (sigma-70 family)